MESVASPLIVGDEKNCLFTAFLFIILADIIKAMMKNKYNKNIVLFVIAIVTIIKIIRIIMVGKLNNIAEEVIRERLRDIYV